MSSGINKRYSYDVFEEKMWLWDLSNYVKKNLKISLSNFLYGYLNDMVYVRSYHVDSHWRKKITILYLRVLSFIYKDNIIKISIYNNILNLSGFFNPCPYLYKKTEEVLIPLFVNKLLIIMIYHIPLFETWWYFIYHSEESYNGSL